MKNFHETKATEIQVRLLSDIPEGVTKVESEGNKRCLYKQIQAEFRDLP